MRRGVNNATPRGRLCQPPSNFCVPIYVYVYGKELEPGSKAPIWGAGRSEQVSGAREFQLHSHSTSRHAAARHPVPRPRLQRRQETGPLGVSRIHQPGTPRCECVQITSRSPTYFTLFEHIHCPIFHSRSFLKFLYLLAFANYWLQRFAFNKDFLFRRLPY